MTRHLEELFDIPPTPTQSTETDVPIAVLEEADSALDKIDSALPQVKALEATDNELDELASLAKDKFNDLMDLGMNVEPRISGQIFQTAGILLGHAITAKQAKIDKKLRMIQLQIQKARLDKTSGSASPTNAAPEAEEIEGKATIIDRNSLLKTILAEAKKNQNE